MNIHVDRLIGGSVLISSYIRRRVWEGGDLIDPHSLNNIIKRKEVYKI